MRVPRIDRVYSTTPQPDHVVYRGYECDQLLLKVYVPLYGPIQNPFTSPYYVAIVYRTNL